MNVDYIAKYIIIGDSRIGKSSLGLKYSKNIFHYETTSTIGLDLLLKNVEINGKKLKIQIWDTAGQERFLSLVQSTYKNTKCVIYCFDITNISSFNNLNYWINNSSSYLDEDCIKCIVGTKKDLENNREVNYIDALNFAAKNNMIYYEISSKNNEGINDLFNNLNNEVIKKFKNKHNPEINLQYYNKKKSICCY
jgi:small GTP-binding protein